jgi:aldose sugar dehydrogenase
MPSSVSVKRGVIPNMIRSSCLLAALSLPVLALTSCANAETGETAGGTAKAGAVEPFVVSEVATFNEPWALAFAPGTPVLFITEKRGAIRVVDTATGNVGSVIGAPEVDYGGQGGLGDIAFLPAETDSEVGTRTIYLSWAEAGEGDEGDTRGAVVGKGQLSCAAPTRCALSSLEVIWRQTPKVTGRGHYSHRLSISPDGHYLYVTSGDRQKMQPAQETTNTLGKIVRLNLDGTPAADNPLAAQGGVSAEIWSWGHRNILGMDWDAQGRLWEAEHGPAGGDELNLVRRGANYGWPVRSNGEHYNGDPIPDHEPSDGFAQPATSWNPVIAPGDMLIYSGTMFGAWQGQALIPGAGRFRWRERARGRPLRYARPPARHCPRARRRDLDCRGRQRRHRRPAIEAYPALMRDAAAATLIPLDAVDPAMIEAVLDRAFGPDRHARTAYRIRAGMDWLPGLSLAALDEHDMLVATIQCWPIALHTPQGQVPLVMVGPVAVVPERQGEGFGVGLMSAMIAEGQRLTGPGVPALPQVLIGDREYYARWGFSASMTGGWRCPGPYEPHRLLARGAALAAMPAEGMLGPWEG